jgi:4-amino-4-deoxy-L-arabinose transferase-like glycosyltransferase
MTGTDTLRVRMADRSLGVRAEIFLAPAALLLAAFLLQGAVFIRANGPTYDEAMHLASGYSYLATGDFRLEPQNPPLIKQFQALPLFLFYRLPFHADTQHWRDGAEFFVGQDFLYRSPLPADRMLLLARLPNLLIGALLVCLIGWWAFRLWGAQAALLAMALACFEPNLLAHSSLVTTDMGTSLFIFLTIYLLWEYFKTPNYWLLAAIGGSLGAAMVSKFSAVVLIPMVGMILVLRVILADGEPRAFLPHRYPARLRAGFVDATAAFLCIAFFAALVIPAAYLFHGFQPWFAGLQRFLELAQAGQPAFFLGEYSYQGWWSYYLVAFLIKTPIGSLILVAVSLFLWRSGRPLERRDAVFLLLPVLVILAVTAQAKVNIGLRHILPIYPFLFVLASRLATVGFRRRWLAPALIGVPLSFTVVSSLSVAPHHLAYFNEIIGGPDRGYRYLADSNLDWGQDLKGVKAYMDREKLPIIYLSYFGSAPPSYYGIRYQYVPGAWPLEWPPPADQVPDEAPRKILAISANNLQDVFTRYNPLFHWLRPRTPVAKIGHSIFLYDLTGDREGLAKLEKTYVRSGIRTRADASLPGT